VEFLLRLVAAFGFIGFALNRAVSRVLPGQLGRIARRRPIGLSLALVLLASLAARQLIFAAPYLVTNPVELTKSIDSLRNQNAAITGFVADQYIVYFTDKNGDHIQDADEAGVSWLYFVGNDDDSLGIIVDSTIPPSTMLATKGHVTVTGRLLRAMGGVEFVQLTIPSFDMRTIPFPIADAELVQAGEFPEVGSAREATAFFGGLAVVLLIAWLMNYLPFRKSGGALGGVPTQMDSGRPVRAWVTGLVESGRTREFVREDEVVASIVRDTYGHIQLLLTPFGRPEPIASIKGGDPVDLGTAFSLGGGRYAIRTRPPQRFVVAFDSISDRDAAARALVLGMS
jgi:hypothetical protein